MLLLDGLGKRYFISIQDLFCTLTVLAFSTNFVILK